MEVKDNGITKMTYKEWIEEGLRIFGKDTPMEDWRFKCPNCGNTQTLNQMLAIGLSPELASKVVGYSCIGRWDDEQGCDYTSGGLFNLAPWRVTTPDGIEIPVFEFSKDESKVPPKKFIELHR